MLILRKVLNSLMAAFLFPVRTLGQAPFSCWPRPELHFRRSLQKPSFFQSENLASCWGLIFVIFRGSCPRNTSETTRRDVIVCKTLCPINNNSLFFSDATLDIAMPIPCKASSHAISGKAFRWRVWENKTPSHHVTRTALAARNNEAYGQRNGRQSFCTVLRYWTLEFSY